MTTMTDSEALAVLDCLVDSYPDWERYSPGAVRLARAHIAEALRDAEVGRKWREDSSLEAWFPFTAEQLRMREVEATRYRWLRNESIGYPYAENTSSPWCVYGPNSSEIESRPIEGFELDAAIDAAMKDEE